MPISNPEVEAGDKTDGSIGYKKRRVSLKQGLAGVFQRMQSKANLVLTSSLLVNPLRAHQRRGGSMKIQDLKTSIIRTSSTPWIEFWDELFLGITACSGESRTIGAQVFLLLRQGAKMLPHATLSCLISSLFI